MSFTPGIPTSGQSLDDTRDDIRNNFANYNTVVSQDHVAPNNTGEGKHNKSTYVAQGAPPVTIAGEIAAFCQTSGAGNSEIYIQRDGVATNYQWTGPASSANGALLKGGTTSILGGLQLKWAVVMAPAGTTAFTWAAESGSAFNLPPLIAGILFGSNSSLFPQSLSAVSATGFSITAAAGPLVVQVIAIGA